MPFFRSQILGTVRLGNSAPVILPSSVEPVPPSPFVFDTILTGDNLLFSGGNVVCPFVNVFGLVYGTVVFTENNTGSRVCWIFKNNDGGDAVAAVSASPDTPTYLNASAFQQFTTNDVISLRLQQSSGIDLTITFARLGVVFFAK